MRGYLGEGRNWLAQILFASADTPSRMRGLVAYRAGHFAQTQGDVAEAATYYEEALTIGRTVNAPDVIALGAQGLGAVASATGDLERASQYLEEALALDRESGNQRGMSVTLGNLGHVAVLRGDLERATDLVEEGLQFSREVGDTHGTIYDLVNLGQLALARQALTDAATFLRDGLRLVMNLGVRDEIVADALASVGGVAGARYQHHQAARLFGAADALVASLGAFLDPILPEVFDHAVAVTRGALGEDAYATHHAAGAVLTLEEAVAEALAVVDDASPR
jgi:tetratricopeptide (TPR) repeat protein